MALHGRLAANDCAPPRPGLLASLRDVECRVERLDLIAGDLLVEAERLMVLLETFQRSRDPATS